MNLHDVLTLAGDALALIGAVAGLLAHGRSSRTAERVADVAKTLDAAVSSLSAQSNSHDAQLTGLGVQVGAATAKADILLASPAAQFLTSPAAQAVEQAVLPALEASLSDYSGGKL